MSEISQSAAGPRTNDILAAGLARRNRAERLFRLYGLLSLSAALLFLFVLLGSIVREGHGAFWQTFVQLDIDFDAAVIDPAGTRDPDALAQADYATLVKRALAARFPEVTERRERRELSSMVSTGAVFALRDQVLAQPSLIENAVEELLRFEPTAQYMRRIVTSDFAVGGMTIPAGIEVVCWIASANRDEQRWGPTVDDLDITREDARQHIAFGKGPHVCLGSWLARLELQVVVGTIVGRFPRTELVEQDLVWSSNVIRGPEELVLQLRS